MLYIGGDDMRKKISYTVEENIIKEFNAICEKKSVNKSALIEKLIIQWTNENK